MSEMTCPACGAGNRPGARFCLECGAALALRCASCNAELPPGARFCDECGTPVGERPSAPAPTVARKVVSIVFADLQGSTALQETLDAESVRRLMDDFYAALRSAIEAHGGTVVKFIGDGVMAGFGVGAVAEDDAWRAVQAATAMQDAFATLGWRADVALRVGVNTGEVIVTEGDTDVVGDAVNVAARLEAAAGPGGILVGEETWRVTRHQAAYEAVEPLVLRGKSEPVPAWRLIGFGAAAVEATASFVGRDLELDQLIAVFDDTVTAGSARLATVIGSPGLGKSRLGAEFVAAVADRATVVATRCTAASASTFAPIAEGLRSVGLDETDVRNALSGSPQETFLAVRRLLEVLAATQPVVLLVDDVHWAEPLLLDLLQHLVEWTRAAPLMVLALARPELREVRPAFVETGRRAAAVVVLEGLAAEAGERLACDLLDTDHLPRALVDRVLAASEGNPLFVRELVRMLVDDAVLVRERGEWRSTIDVEAIDVPPTIQSLLAARIERLPVAERTILERAAVVGREFYRGAVAELLPPADRHELDTHLERLRQKDLVEPEGTYWIDEPVLRFHHVLLRDAAYRRLLKEVRADLHGRHAAWLEAKGGDGAGDDVIGYHLEQAHRYRIELGATDEETVALGSRAADRLAAAGRQALDRDDLRSAAGLLGRALECVVPDDPRRADLLIDRCEALITTGALGAAASALTELEQLALGSPRLDAWSASFNAQLAILTEPERLVDTATAVAEAAARFVELGDTAGAAKAHAVHASALARLGRVAECEAALDRALAAARQAGDSRRATGVLAGAPLAALWGPSPVPRASGRCLDVVRVLRITTGATTVEATSLRCQAVLEALRGRTDASRRMLAAARRSLEELGHRHGLLSTDMFAGLVELLADDPAAAEVPLREATAGFKQLGVDVDAAQAAALLARALLAQGRVDEAEALTYESEKLGGADLKTAIAWRAARAEALAWRGALDEALDLARAAVALAASTDALLDQADTHLALATVLARAGDLRNAQAEAQRAADLYQQKGASVLVERAAALVAGRPQNAPLNQEHPAAPSRRVRPNLVTQAGERAEAALRDRDPDAYAKAVAPDAVTRDHILQIERPSRSGDMNVIGGVAVEVLATLGDRHGLVRAHITLRGDEAGSSHVEDLRIQRCDTEGRVVLTERLAPDDLNEALARLLELYAEDEAPPASRPALEGSAAIYRELGISLEVLRRMPEDAVLVDHRPASLGTLVGRREILAATDALVELAGELSSRTVDVLGLTDDVQLIEYVIEARGAEFPLIVLLRLGPDGVPVRLEWFPPEQREDALARFDELTRDESGRRLRNAAVDNAERCRVALAADDKTALHELVHPDVVFEDRRQFNRLVLRGREHFLANTDAMKDAREHTHLPLAVRGDRLALFRSTFTGENEAGGSFDAEALTVVEVDERGRVVADIAFDPDGLQAALNELDERWLATGEPDPEIWPLAMRFIAAYNRRQFDDFGELIAPDFVGIDHRQTGWGRVDRPAFLRATGALLDVAPDVVMYAVDVPLITERGWAGAVVNVGHVEDGGTYELARTTLGLARDGRIERIEIFAAEDLDHAVTRLREYTVAGSAIRRGCGVDNLALEHLRAIEHMKWPEVKEHFSPDLCLADRRSGVGLTVTGADAFANLRLISESTELTEVVPIAIRGELISLQRMRFGAGSAHEWEMLHLLEVDHDGRAVFEASYDVDQLDVALEELDDRFLAGEAAEFGAVLEVTRRFLAAYNSRDWEALEAVCAPDFRLDDHTPAGWGVLDVRQWLDLDEELLSAITEMRLYAADIRLISDGGVAAIVVNAGTDSEGGEFALERAVAALVSEGKIQRFELFDRDDVDAAVAVVRGSSGLSALENLATRTAAAYVKLAEARDWNGAGAFLTIDSVLEDRRRGFRSRLEGREAGIANAKEMAGARQTHREVLAARGERLALFHTKWGPSVDGIGDFETEILDIVEVDGSGRIVHDVIFDADEIDAAFDELDDRYERGEGAPFAGLHALGRRAFALWDDRQWDELVAVFADDGVMVDRRPLGWGEVTPADFVHRLRTLADMFSEATLREIAVIRATPDASLALMHGRGRALDGGEVEIPFCALLVWDGERLTRLEFLDADDAAGAIARFDELTLEGRASPAHSQNLATAAADQLMDRTLAHDPGGAAAVYAPEGVIDDRRSGLASLVTGADGFVLSARAMADVTSSEATTLATRGERLSLSHVLWRGGDRFEVETMHVIEADPDGLILANVVFDPADLDAAYAELDRRFAEGQGATSQPPALPMTLALEGADRYDEHFRRRDWDGIAELIAEDVTIDDRRFQQRVEGRATVLQNLQLIGDVMQRSCTPVATRGQLLALLRCAYSSGRGEGHVEMDSLEVGEIDADGKLRAIVAFASDDVDAAFEELDRLFLTREGAVNPGAVLLSRGLLDAIVRRDWAAFESYIAPDATFVDHRAMGWATRGREEYMSSLRDLVAMVPDIASENLAVPRISAQGVVGVWRFAGTYGDGSRFENARVLVILNDGRLITRAESFSLEDLDAANARFDELTAAPTTSDRVVTNRALAVSRRVAELQLAHEREAVLSAHADDYVVHDRRRAVQLSIHGRERLDELMDLQQAVDEIVIEPLATRGDRLCLHRTRLLGTADSGGRFEVELVEVIQIDEQDRIKSETVFDVIDLDAAVKELDQRFAAVARFDERTRSIASNAAERTSDEVLRHLVANDSGAFGDLLAEHAVLDDRRRGMRNVMSGRTALVANFRRMFGVNDTESECIATTGDRLALCRLTWRGVVDDAQFEIEFLCLTELDAAGMITAIVLFDVEDREDAGQEMADRFRAGAGAVYPVVADLSFGLGDMWRTRDWGATAALFARDATVADHRPLGWGEVTAPDFVSRARALTELAPTARLEGVAMPRFDERGSVTVVRGTGVTNDGVDFEMSFVSVILVRDDRIGRLELFPFEEVDAALERFDAAPQANSPG